MVQIALCDPCFRYMNCIFVISLFFLSIGDSPQHAIMLCLSLLFLVDVFLLFKHFLLMRIFLFRSSLERMDINVVTVVAELLFVT